MLKKKNRIKILSPILINKIAAGEVIEGPSSVIKELIENSLDAGASSIQIKTKAAGTESIIVEDDGHGIYAEDLKKSITRHATSKISHLEDLEKITSLGFRGEALAAIASISHLQIKSCHKDEQIGAEITYRGGQILAEGVSKHLQGTTIHVNNLFYSTPARRKYLKSIRAENIKNHKEIMRLAIAVPNVKFSYYREEKELLSCPKNQSYNERILSLYGKSLENKLIEVEMKGEQIELLAYISTPEYFRATRDLQFVFVNDRAVEIKNLSFVVRKAYGELIAHGMHPCFFIFLNINTTRLDINVHPQKKEVRLLDQSSIQGIIYKAITNALRSNTPINIDQITHTNHPFTNQNQNYNQDVLLETGLQYTPPYTMNFNSKDNQNKGSNDESIFQKEEIVKRIISKKSNETSTGSYEQEKEKINSLTGMQFTRHFGTILGTYVLAEGNDNMYIIDQHTAHERINYERNLKQMAKIKNKDQELLEPILINCLPNELEDILNCSEKLKENGFFIEETGPRSYRVRKVPAYLEPGTEIKILTLLIQKIIEGESDLHVYKDYSAMKACKASIKKNDYISNELLADILKELPLCDEPGRCPHGRPTMIQISRMQLDKMFHRS